MWSVDLRHGTFQVLLDKSLHVLCHARQPEAILQQDGLTGPWVPVSTDECVNMLRIGDIQHV